MTDEARAGARFVLGVESPGRASTNLRLPGGYRYETGTVSCVCQTREGVYLVTAAHVVAGDVFRAGASLDVGGSFVIAFSDGRAHTCLTAPPRLIRPQFPTRWTDGAPIDAAAIPLPSEIAAVLDARMAVPDAIDLTHFRGEDAVIVVERSGQRRELPVVVDRVTGTGEARWPDAPRATLPQCVWLRFLGETTVGGDSGAPVLCRRAGIEYFLGVHFAEFGDGPDDWGRSVSVATAASTVFEHLGLEQG